MIAGKGTRNVDGLIAVLAEESSVLYTENESWFLLADIAARKRIGEAVEVEPLVLAGKLVGCMDLHVAACAERSLVGAANHRRLRLLTCITLDLHLPTQLPVFSGHKVLQYFDMPVQREESLLSPLGQIGRAHV